MSDASSQVRKQVEQMKQFILSEADEKAQEIVDKARNEAEATKQETLKREKEKVEVQFKKDVEALRTEERVRQAKHKKELDDSVLQGRVAATTAVQQAAAEILKRVTSNRDEYRKLLQQLTVQAAFILEGPALVRCRPADRELINLNDAAQKAEALLKQCGRGRAITLKFDSQELPEAQIGGVFLKLDGGDVQVGTITCDNTLRSRMTTCLEEYAPVLRHELFNERPIHSA
eukprot:TRINITY_DN48279_c0_g1_i1.p2 TRINITY_DN48279_c0_g1~~TRINITY_DN48279_c0_g1_i1.p2  ORF type:complete len:231 (+),score=93.56 TRINITY_DN48279_c0_g1_i1:110-802(+)